MAWAHLTALPPTLEDLDSVNFALGVERFDVSAHRPHPPGYPLYIAAGKVSDAALSAVVPHWTRDRRAAVGLAIWSVVAAVAAVWVLAGLWTTLGLSPPQATVAAALALVSPLFWVAASRPLSDVPGLVAALTVQCGLLAGLRAFRGHTGASPGVVPRAWWWAAIGAGAAIGLRTQTLWLTAPLLCWCIGELAARRRWRDAAALIGCSAVGVLVWFGPLVAATGGWAVYSDVLGSQGTEDFIGVEMLATQPSWSLLVEALHRTFVAPWLDETLAGAMLVLAVVGALRLMGRHPHTLAFILLGFWPYAVFHLTFQETATLRYSLPLIVPVAGLAVVGLSAMSQRLALATGTLVACASLAVAWTPLVAYGQAGAPIFRAFADLDGRVVGMHHRVASEARQAIVWATAERPLTLLPTARGAEVHAVVDYWRGGGTEPVWFLANPVRRDLSLIDHRAVLRRERYTWHEDTRALVAIARPTDIDAWVMAAPRWMLGRGWAVTPEVGGVTTALGLGPHRAPAEAYLRRDRTPLRVVIGGRTLGSDVHALKTLVARLDGREVARWQNSPPQREFLQWINLPDGVPDGEGVYGILAVSVEVPQRGRPVGLEFFDAATPDDVLWVYDQGWYEPELQAGTGVIWRWMGGEATLTIVAPPGDLSVTLRGESPRRYFAVGSDLTVYAGTEIVAQQHLADDFEISLVVPAAARAASDGRLRLVTSATFVPSERGESADQRPLGLRIFDVHVTKR